MTESEWLTCTDPTPMLEFQRGKASDRKLRLFACACCRRIWSLPRSEVSRKAVEVAERFADGLATVDDLNQIRKGAEQEADDCDSSFGTTCMHWQHHPSYSTDEELTLLQKQWHAARAFAAVAWPVERHRSGAAWNEAAIRATGAVVEAVQKTFESFSGPQVGQAEKGNQASLLREVVRLPAPVGNRPWLAWEGGTVRHLAQGIYDDRAFDCCPILADALEEAGCPDQSILDHLREPGPHVRGCWVLDLLLGKE